MGVSKPPSLPCTGFVTYYDPRSADRAICALHGALTLALAQPLVRRLQFPGNHVVLPMERWKLALWDAVRDATVYSVQTTCTVRIYASKIRLAPPAGQSQCV